MAKHEHPFLSSKHYWLNSIYLVLLGVLATVLFELIKDGHWLSLRSLAVLLLIVALLAGTYEKFRRAMRDRKSGPSIFGGPVRGAIGLIALVSKGAGCSAALAAAEYHAKRDLRHLWLVTTSDAEGDANWVTEQVKAQHQSVSVYRELVPDKDNIFDVKARVENVIRSAIKDHQIPNEDLICDFTGMTKNTSAGMIFACASRNARLEYMLPNQGDERGNAVPGATSEPYEIFIEYEVIEKAD